MGPLGHMISGGMAILTENDVVDAVAAHLAAIGFIVESTCTTRETGIDIVALESATGRRLRVEAKGATSSKEHTARYSLGFNPGQIRSHVSRALYEAAVILGRHPNDYVALALPDDSQHRERMDSIQASLDKLGIAVFFVNRDRSVRLVGKVGTETTAPH